MKTKMILAGILAALITAPLAALGADLPQPSYKAPAFVAPAYANWSGFYVGINGGYGLGSSKWDTPSVSLSPSGEMAGLTLGYNYQTGLWVWSAEGDIDWADISDSKSCTVGLVAGSCKTENDWLGTLRGRFGYAGWHNWLPYITMGAAFGDVKATSPVGSASKVQIGWTAGLGVEYAWRSNWSVKAEYLYVNLGSLDCGTACGVASDNVKYNANLLRLGLNYRF